MRFQTLLIGTSNAGKVVEMRHALEGLPVELSSLEDYPSVRIPSEDGESYADIAREKATDLARQTGQAVLADDSGLEVAALDGAPGIRSARYAGEGASDRDRIDHVLRELSGRGVRSSPALFRCCVALAVPGEVLFVVEGECHGEIAPPARGDSGFGYDPIFTPAGYSETFGELPAGVKRKISHRARALREVRERLNRLLGD